ncbi:FAD:protein FMN transferase [Chloroflexota bacterium]
MKVIKKSYQVITGLLILLIVLSMSVTCTGEPPLMFEETRSLMDTYVKVAVYSDEETAVAAINAAFDRMEEIVNIATTFDEEGEAFRLNQDEYVDTPSDELLELITMAIDYSELTGGSFDITCQPLLDLWSFQPDADKQFWELDETTQKARINEASKLLGSDKIVIEENRIYFKENGMKITLGGIAKGYTVDKALEVIKDMGIKYAMIDAGGDISTLGSKPRGELWSIALVNPDDTSQSLATFRVHDKSITTSGNYERYFDPEKKAGHIMDPRTGYSTDECISVTIIADNCTYADALATGIFVMGPEDGMALIESLDDVECLIVDADRVIHHSSGLSEYLNER